MKKKKKRRRKKFSRQVWKERRREDEEEEEKKAAEEKKGSGSLSESSEGLVPSTADKLELGATVRFLVLGPSGACVESDMR